MVFDIKDYEGFKVAVEELCSFLSAEKIPSQNIFDSRLVLHELLGNALQHSASGARVQAEIEEEFIKILVQAEKAFCPPERGVCPDAYAERGRGFFLVDSVSAERIYTEKGGILVRIRIR